MVLPSEPAGPCPRTIQEGELVIVYESFNSIKSVYIDKKAQYQNRFGTFHHKDWLGQAYGSKVHCGPPGRGWVYLLAPTPELWTQVLRHRTQILYVADISLVVANLSLSPGKVVLESGTGSGSLTHSLARAVAPSGHVHTFDFHALRADEARAEFEKHGLASLVTVAQRNIEELGFPEGLSGQADSVFLDLPGPWKVVGSAGRCLKPGGGFCSFSPCIEQVQRTCEALDRQGFTDIRTLEVLLRTYEVSVETLHTDVAHMQQQSNRQNKKRSRTAAAATDAAAAGAAAAGAEAAAGEGGEPAAAAAAGDGGSVQQVMAKPLMEARGHTGYLTFARRFVAAVPLAAAADSGGDEEEEQEEAAAAAAEGVEAAAAGGDADADAGVDGQGI